jgi:hypothetical protein
MNKTRQQELTRWLKQQSVISRRWLMMSRLLGGQWRSYRCPGLDTRQNPESYDMENIPREALLLLCFVGADFCFTRWSSGWRERVGFHAGVHIRFEIRRQVLDRPAAGIQPGFRVNPQAVGLRLSLSKLTICMISMRVICRSKWRWPQRAVVDSLRLSSIN